MTTSTLGLFATVPDKDFFHIFDKGSPDVNKIAAILKYKRTDFSAALDMPLAKVRLDKPKVPKEMLDRLVEWGVIINLVGTFFKDKQKTILWFSTSNPMLGSLPPRDMIRLGRFKKLLKFVQTALEENR
ncbi:MAG: hypothetical protein V3S46_05725 [Nitrospinota bacterium]